MRKSFLRSKWPAFTLLAVLVLLSCFAGAVSERSVNGVDGKAGQRRLIYAAVPGIRSYLEHGGHGLLVFDIDNGHRFVKRIPTTGLDPTGKPLKH